MASAPTILVLDDDADMRYLHRCELEKEFPGCFVVECPTIADALARSGTVCLDLVLTDHMLSEDNGAIFIAQLRQMGLRCPVVLVTGSSDPKVHEAAYAAGATHVFYGTKQGFAPLLRPILEKAAGAVAA